MDPPPRLSRHYGWIRFRGESQRRRALDAEEADREALRRALEARPWVELDRGFTLRQVRENVRVRELMPSLDVDAITFETGSAAIPPRQARRLDELGRAIEDILDENPDELFLVEGHTDAVGGRAMNLALSDRRAESVALALTEFYDIPPENLIAQGYGEEHLKVETGGAERANRRATVRRITPLLSARR
jgi:outer membrane protein OmpA-like peptidoglycan-associated protein